MTTLRTRRLAAGAWAMLPLGLLLVASVLLPPPAQVPTRWGPGAQAVGQSSGAALLGTTFTVAVLATVGAAAVTGLTRLVPAHLSRVVLAVAGAVGAGALTAYVGTVVGTGLAGDDPGQVGVGWALVAVPVALLWGWTGYVVHAEHRPTLADVQDSVPERDRIVAGTSSPWAADTGAVVLPWVSQTRSPSLRWVAALVAGTVLLIIVLLGVSGEGWLVTTVVAVVGLGLVVLVHACTEVSLHVDVAGLRLRSRRVPLTLVRVRAVDVVGAGVSDLDPLDWGGWGLRWLPDRTAYIGAGGPGIVVHRRSGRRLAVELTEGEAAAVAGAGALRRAAAQARAETPSR